jgi:ATP-dependent DNA helicase DinG
MAKDGKIAATLPGFVPRSQQVEACRSIEAAMDGMSDIALIEAGTGVGKTLAYLLPAVSHASRDFRVVISTHTLALQAQLWEKDLPMVLGLTKSAPKAALLKGRGNYLCISHLVNARSEMSGVSDPLFDRLVAWSQETETGDVADLDFAYPSWHEIRAESDSCRGKDARSTTTASCTVRARWPRTRP